MQSKVCQRERYAIDQLPIRCQRRTWWSAHLLGTFDILSPLACTNPYAERWPNVLQNRWQRYALPMGRAMAKSRARATWCAECKKTCVPSLDVAHSVGKCLIGLLQLTVNLRTRQTKDYAANPVAKNSRGYATKDDLLSVGWLSGGSGLWTLKTGRWTSHWA